MPMSDTGGRGLVLVVEDEPAIAQLQRLYLTRHGFSVQIETTGDAALRAVEAVRPVAIVLDIGIPGIDGIQVCRRLRSSSDNTPIIFVTARDDEVDRILGLEIGADDYVTKPFSPRELVARVDAVLRRGAAIGPILTTGALVVDIHARSVTVDGTTIALTATEFDLLAHLLSHPGRVYSREQLLSAVWGYAGPGSRTVDVHVAQLRSKLGPASPIQTVRGVGYAARRPC